MSIMHNGEKVLNNLTTVPITQTIDSTSTEKDIPSAKAVNDKITTLDSENFKMSVDLLFNSDSDCTDGKLVIGQEYTAKSPLLPHKMARLTIWWRPCHFSQAAWFDDTWGYVDGFMNEIDINANHYFIYTVRVLFRHADTKQFKVAYAKRLDFDLATNSFTCQDIAGTCGFAIQIYK